MEETKMKQEHEDFSSEVVVGAKKPRISEIYDGNNVGDMGEDIMAWLSVDDETVGELMKLLETTTTTTTATTISNTTAASSSTRVKFISNPYSSSLIFQSSSSYITINGNEESCGSSFSDSDSSFMASIDMGGIVNFVRDDFKVGFGEGNDGGGGAWGSNEVEARGWIVEEMEEEESGSGDSGMDGCDGFDWDWDGDDEMLARFLGEDLF